MSKKRRQKEKKKFVIPAVIGGSLIVLFLIGIIVANVFPKDDIKEIIDKIPNKPEQKEEKRIQIVDVNSKSRNVAVMINNIKSVWGYQSGLNDAYIIYEIITEGGISRMMAIFKDQNTTRIGTVRSSRIYFLDYALENDAIYIHVGGSKEALRDIKTLGVASLNAQTTFRDKSLGLSSEHTAFTSMERINEKVSSRKIRNTTNQELLLNYSIDEINMAEIEGAKVANNVYISYSASKSTSFIYDAEKKVYNRFQNDKAHIDYVTKEQYTAKNIITYQVKNSSYDSYGRQKLDNIGTGNGYYISNGYSIPITWEKKSRTAQTTYRYLNGEEINVNDGNTYIQIQPLNRKLEITD